MSDKTDSTLVVRNFLKYLAEGRSANSALKYAYKYSKCESVSSSCVIRRLVEVRACTLPLERLYQPDPEKKIIFVYVHTKIVFGLSQTQLCSFTYKTGGVEYGPFNRTQLLIWKGDTGDKDFLETELMIFIGEINTEMCLKVKDLM